MSFSRAESAVRVAPSVRLPVSKLGTVHARTHSATPPPPPRPAATSCWNTMHAHHRCMCRWCIAFPRFVSFLFLPAWSTTGVQGGGSSRSQRGWVLLGCGAQCDCVGVCTGEGPGQPGGGENGRPLQMLFCPAAAAAASPSKPKCFRMV